MTERERLAPSLGDYMKGFFFHTDVGLIVAVIGIVVAGYGAYNVGSRVLDHYFPEQAILKNVIGNKQPDVYIEKDGVKYFSHIDGKDISDLVNE